MEHLLSTQFSQWAQERECDLEIPGHSEPISSLKQPWGCEFCDVPSVDKTTRGRILVVCFDGTSQKATGTPSNVVHFFTQIIDDGRQLKYYNSGIGTYANHPRQKWKNPFNYVGSKIDEMVARNFEKILLAGYRFLIDHYNPGDKIFVFGYSRGAYQARTLTRMISRVGLLHPGNYEQIPFAYELYVALMNRNNKGNSLEEEAENFRSKFSRKRAQVHFVGVWDTVSSIGVDSGTGKLQIEKEDCHHLEACYFRHALALDECRLKFVPEYISCKQSTLEYAGDGTAGPRIKEVWFAGCHSDIGGGDNAKWTMSITWFPFLWMTCEAERAGLKVEPERIGWELLNFQEFKASRSPEGGWRLLEGAPFKRTVYDGDSSRTTRAPHLSQGRVILPGQLIHLSVCLLNNYTPRATFLDNDYKWEMFLNQEDIQSLLRSDYGSGSSQMASRTPHSFTLNPDIRDKIEWNTFNFSSVKQLVRGAEGEGGDHFGPAGLLWSLALTPGAENVLNVFEESPLLAMVMMRRVWVKWTPNFLSQLVINDQFLPRRRREFLWTIISHFVPDDNWSDLHPYALGKLARCYGLLPLPFLHDDGFIQTLGNDSSSVPWFAKSCLASILFSRSLEIHDDEHLQVALEHIQDAIELLQESDINHPFLRNSLATIKEAEGTLDAVYSATRIREKLEAEYPRSFALHLTNSALKLSDIYMAPHLPTTDFETALRTSRDSSDTTPRIELAKALANISIRCHRLSRADEALMAAEYSVVMLAELSLDSPDLSAARNNLSNRLCNAGGHQAALHAMEQVVQTYHGLARQNPEAYLLDLAVALTNLSLRLMDFGRYNEARVECLNAVEICRGLPSEQQKPGKFSNAMVSSLRALSMCLTATGSFSDALKTMKEGTLWSSTLERPSARAAFLHDLSNSYARIGDHQNAFNASEKALEQLEQLAARMPEIFNSPLALSLHNTGTHLSSLERHQEALDKIQRSVGIYRGLVHAQPSIYTPLLAQALNNHSNILSLIGDPKQAMREIQEAVHLGVVARKFDVSYPGLAPPVLRITEIATQLLNDSGFGTGVEEIGTEEAARPHMSPRDSDELSAILIGSLSNFILRHSVDNQYEAVLPTIKELVSACLEMGALFRGEFRSSFIQLRNTLFFQLFSAGHYSEAYKEMGETLRLCQEYGYHRTATFNPLLIQTLRFVSSLLLPSEQPTDVEIKDVVEQCLELFVPGFPVKLDRRLDGTLGKLCCLLLDATEEGNQGVKIEGTETKGVASEGAKIESVETGGSGIGGREIEDVRIKVVEIEGLRMEGVETEGRETISRGKSD